MKIKLLIVFLLAGFTARSQDLETDLQLEFGLANQFFFNEGSYEGQKMNSVFVIRTRAAWRIPNAARRASVAVSNSRWIESPMPSQSNPPSIALGSSRGSAPRSAGR